jgi:hypothetical protein
MIIKSEFTIDITASDFISGDIYRANNISELKPIILIIHGFKVHKQWGFFPYICDYFAQYGAIAICCNLSLNGYGSDSDTLIYPHKLFTEFFLSTNKKSFISLESGLIERHLLKQSIAFFLSLRTKPYIKPKLR